MWGASMRLLREQTKSEREREREREVRAEYVSSPQQDTSEEGKAPTLLGYLSSSPPQRHPQQQSHERKQQQIRCRACPAPSSPQAPPQNTTSTESKYKGRLLYLVRSGGRGPHEYRLRVVGVYVHGRPQQIQPGGLRDRFLFCSFRDFHREVRGVSVVPEEGRSGRKRSMTRKKSEHTVNSSLFICFRQGSAGVSQFRAELVALGKFLTKLGFVRCLRQLFGVFRSRKF